VNKARNFFAVHVRKDGKVHYGGQYLDENIAGWAANQLALQLYGENIARKNDVQLEGYQFVKNRAIQKT
jgi:hypothetical protein